MHRDRNNNSWSELKVKRHHSEFDDVPLKFEDATQSNDSRKEKNDRAARQLDGVKNMFKNMADYDHKQNKRSQK